MSVIKCCKDCEKRYVGCHAKCGQYIAEKKALVEERNNGNKRYAFTGRAYTESKVWNHRAPLNKFHRQRGNRHD